VREEGPKKGIDKERVINSSITRSSAIRKGIKPKTPKPQNKNKKTTGCSKKITGGGGKQMKVKEISEAKLSRKALAT